MNAIAKYVPRPLLAVERKDFQSHQLSAAGELAEAKQGTGRVVWLSAAMLFVGSVVANIPVMMALPHLKSRVENHWIRIHDNGEQDVVAGAKDAPKLFQDRDNEHWAQVYSEEWEEFSEERDPENFRKVEIMSSEEQRMRYDAWRNDPLNPVKNLGRHGNVITWGYQFYKEPAVASEPYKTFIYRMTFKRRATEGANVKPIENWQGEIQFQWQTDKQMTPEQEHDNPSRFTVVGYKADKQP